MRKRLWIAATIISALALLGTAAGAANSGADLSTLDPEGIAASVLSNLPTTGATQASEHANVAADNDEDATENEANENDENEEISPSTEAAPSGTSSARPGWGCGDTNHEHSGPPGRPGATPPPGCDKAGGDHGSTNSSHSTGSSNASQQGVTQSTNHSNKGKGK